MSARCPSPAAWPICGGPPTAPARPGGVYPRIGPGRHQPGPRPAHRRPADPGVRRRDHRASGDGRGRPPVRRRGQARALGVIGGLTFLGMAAGPFAGAAILGRSIPARPWRGGCRRRPAADPLRAGLALGLLPQRADRRGRPPAGLGGHHRLGYAAPVDPGRPCRWSRVHGRARRAAGRAHPGRDRRGGVAGRPGRGRIGGPGRGHRVRRPAAGSIHRRAPVPGSRLRVGRARLAPDRLRVCHGDHRRRGLRRPRAVRRSGRPGGCSRSARRGYGRGRPGIRLHRPGGVAQDRHPGRPAPRDLRPGRHVALDAGDVAGGRLGLDGRVRAGLRADRDAALDGRRGAGRRGRLRDRLGDGDRGPDDRDGDRAGGPDGLRLNRHRPPARPDLQHPGGYLQYIPADSRGATCTTRWWSERSRPGRRAKPPGSWSGCS